MNRKLKYVAIASAIIIPVAAGIGIVAHAKHSGMSEEALVERFEQLDRNDDGKVTTREIYEGRKARFSEIDSNQDGTVSVEELDAAKTEFRHRRLEHRLQRMDTDGDGGVGVEEYARAGGKWLHRVDRNDDGAVDMDEIRKMSKHRWKHRHGDGYR